MRDDLQINAGAMHARIDEYRKKALEMRADVLRAREMIGSTHLSVGFAEELARIASIAQTYQPADGAPAAIYALARVTDRLERLLAPWRYIEGYEALQEQIRQLEEAYG